MLSVIVAAADNDVIGRDNQLPWRLPADLARFKALTLGKPIIMGRKTFESLGRVLPGRPHVVISRQALTLPEQCHLASSLQDALTKARALTADQGELMLIGGGELYAQGLPVADRLYLTRVHVSPEGDTHFPAVDPECWTVIDQEFVAGEPACTFFVYERTGAKPSLE